MLTDVGGIGEHESLLRLVYAEALHAEGNIPAAEATIREARARLIERADKLTAQADRARFLEQVLENKRTLELAKAWGVG